MAEGHRQRMRDRFYDGGEVFDNFKPHEVLEMILYFTIPRRNTNELAHALIDRFGSFHGVLNADRNDLLDFGLTENTVALLKMIPAFSNFYMHSLVKGTPYLTNTTSLGNFAAGMIGERPYEIFGAIFLTAQMKYINFEIIEIGTVNQSNVNLRKVMEAVIRNKAVRVAFVHNHPGGSLMPSREDKALTKRLSDLLGAINVTVIDHFIVANGRFASMQELGAMND